MSDFRSLIFLCTFSITKVSDFLDFRFFLEPNLPSQFFRLGVHLWVQGTCPKTNFWCWFDLCCRFRNISSLFANFRSQSWQLFGLSSPFADLYFFPHRSTLGHDKYDSRPFFDAESICAISFLIAHRVFRIFGLQVKQWSKVRKVVNFWWSKICKKRRDLAKQMA